MIAKRTTPRTWRCTSCLGRSTGKKCDSCGTRKGTLRGSSRTRADTLWSKHIRAGGRCRRCGRVGPVDAAHIIGRARLVVRHDLDNGIALCRDCHQKFDSYQFDREDFIVSILGVERYAALRQRATQAWDYTYPIAALKEAQ